MQRASFNQGWQFHLGNHEGWGWQLPKDTDWRPVDLPHDWSIEQERAPGNPSGVSGGFFPMGNGWYRKTFEVPESWRGKHVYVEFEGIYMNAELWLNEHFLIRHPYGYTSFLVDLTPYLSFGAPNALTVSVDNVSQLNSRWYSGSGIYRPVWLLVANPVHIDAWGTYVTTPKVGVDEATVQVETAIVNGTGAVQEVVLRSTVLAADDGVVATAEARAVIGAQSTLTYTQILEVTGPKLWSPDSPALYHLKTEASIAGTVVDTATTPFGIRSLHFSAERGFLLNGEPVLLKGGCVHHDNGILGAASFPRSEARKVEIHKASGYNAIRCAHNPPAPAFLDACDRLGMLVIDEAFDCWRQGKNPYDYHVAFDDWWQRDIDSMVRRDRNHPSIIIWSIGNEVLERDGRSQGVEIARQLAERVRALDDTRPITSAICGVWDPIGVNGMKRTWEDTAPVFATLGVGGYNYQWRQYQPDHERYPERIMAGTESFPIEAFENWSSVEELSYVIGDFVWTSLDYLGESGIGRVIFEEEKTDFLGGYPWHQANCGDLDLCGFKRPQSYYRDILWGSGSKLYIAVHTPAPEGKTPKITQWGWPEVWPNWTWPGHEGKIFKVEVYSGCEAVELWLNGSSLGVRPTSRDEKHIATFEVPYAPGELKAVGLDGNEPVAECVVTTVGEPVRLVLKPDRRVIHVEGGDLSFITVEAVDAEGRVHPTATDRVFFTIKGVGSIAALGNSDPMSTERYRGHARSLFRGRCLVVVKPDGRPGEINLRAQADGLEVAEVTIHTM